MKPRRSRPPLAPLCWPSAIPRPRRGVTDAGGDGFFLHRRPLYEHECFHDRAVELTGNLLVVAVHGGLILRRGEQTQVLHEGAACLVTAGALNITELAPSAAGAPELYYFFFGDRIIRRHFPDLASVERQTLVMHPACTEFYPVAQLPAPPATGP